MRCVRSPLARDHRLLLDTDHAQVVAHLTGPSAIAAWFDGVERHELGGGQVVWSHTTTQLHMRGRAVWVPEQSGLVLHVRHEQVMAFFTVREIVVTDPPGVATEILVHLDAPNTRRGRQLGRVFTRTATAGLDHMRAELGR